MLNNKYDFMFMIQAKDCNPNGDPDLGNLPRIDDEDMHGIITDVAIKRKIRDYIEEAFNGTDGMDIIMRNGANMNRSICEIVNLAQDKKENSEKSYTASELACQKYYDVRTFGGVLSTGLNAGQITGPVQLEMARSLDTIYQKDITITRLCHTDGKFKTVDEYDKADSKIDDDKKRTMGRKQFIPYGLYVVHGAVSANLANKTGFSEEDLSCLFESILNMYEHSSSASKAGMSVVGPIIIFKHTGNTLKDNEKQLRRECLLGCAPSYKLFSLVNISLKENVEYPRDYTDYNIVIDYNNIPNGITLGFKEMPFEDIKWNKDIDVNWIKFI